MMRTSLPMLVLLPLLTCQAYTLNRNDRAKTRIALSRRQNVDSTSSDTPLTSTFVNGASDGPLPSTQSASDGSSPAALPASDQSFPFTQPSAYGSSTTAPLDFDGSSSAAPSASDEPSSSRSPASASSFAPTASNGISPSAPTPSPPVSPESDEAFFSSSSPLSSKDQPLPSTTQPPPSTTQPLERMSSPSVLEPSSDKPSSSSGLQDGYATTPEESATTSFYPTDSDNESNFVLFTSDPTWYQGPKDEKPDIVYILESMKKRNKQMSS